MLLQFFTTAQRSFNRWAVTRARRVVVLVVLVGGGKVARRVVNVVLSKSALD